MTPADAAEGAVSDAIWAMRRLRDALLAAGDEEGAAKTDEDVRALIRVLLHTVERASAKRREATPARNGGAKR